MNKALKWILVVLVGVIVLAIIAGIVFAFVGAARYGVVRQGIRPFMPYQNYQFGGFRGLGVIFGGLLGLGVFILVVVGIVALISALFRNNRPAQIAPPAQPPAAVRTCPNCGKPAQEDWKTCPYCGTPLS
jgi:hypothetical protein